MRRHEQIEKLNLKKIGVKPDCWDHKGFTIEKISGKFEVTAPGGAKYGSFLSLNRAQEAIDEDY